MPTSAVTSLPDSDSVQLPPDLLAERALALCVPCPYCRARPGRPCTIADIYDQRRDARVQHAIRTNLARRSRNTVRSLASTTGAGREAAERAGHRPLRRTSSASASHRGPRGVVSAARPLLYLDVDGPLVPFAAEHRPQGYQGFRLPPRTDTDCAPGSGAVRRVWLQPAHGPQLRALTEIYDMVWATAWRQDANAWIRPILELPHLPVLPWPGTSATWCDPVATFRAIVEHAGPRPFVWVAAGIDDTVRGHADRHAAGRAFVHSVDPEQGLAERDFMVLHAATRIVSTTPPIAA